MGADFDERLALVEAALYATGRPLSWRELASVLGESSKDEVLKLAITLVEEYRRRGGALEVVELQGERFVLQLKPSYALRVRPLMPKFPSKAALRTLAYIAFKQPVLQSRVIKVRGSHAYKHLKMLEALGFITREKNQRGKIVIRTTELFSEYLNLSKEPRRMKRQLREKLKAENIQTYLQKEKHKEEG